MPPGDVDALKQIEELLGTVEGWTSKSQAYDGSDIPMSVRVELVTRTQALVARLAPPGSCYLTNVEQLVKKYPPLTHSHMFIRQIPGILKALRTDYSAGYLRTVNELIHADVFSDFLEMADHLLEEGYKDPAAVLVGGVLEEHLRKLCEKHGILAVQAGRPNKAETMNTDLAGASVYSKLDQKNVTAWLDLRNKAAHAKYAEYEKEQVRLLIQSVRDFLTRVPA